MTPGTTVEVTGCHDCPLYEYHDESMTNNCRHTDRPADLFEAVGRKEKQDGRPKDCPLDRSGPLHIWSDDPYSFASLGNANEDEDDCEYYGED